MRDRYIKLNKGNVELVVDRVGAQLVSVKMDGVEIMSQGAVNPESSSWKATAKNLFPNPGPVGTVSEEYGELDTRLVDMGGTKLDKQVVYHHNGGLYSMGQHGFAQFLEYKVSGKTDKSLLMYIQANQKTADHYPYDFIYHVGFEIKADGYIEYMSCAQNEDTKPMLAGMGWHPAFALHFEPSSYKIVFRNLKKTADCTLQEGVEYDLVTDHSVSYGGIESVDVDLVHIDKKGERVPYLTMHSEEPRLVFWSKPPAKEGEQPFICIEPWNTKSKQIQKLTTQDKTRDIEDAVIIEPGEQKMLKASIKVEPAYVAEVIRQNDLKKESESQCLYNMVEAEYELEL